MEKLTDEELMDHVSHDDLDCMRVLYNRYHKWIFNFFMQMTQDRNSSEDLVQSTFYKALKYRKSYRGGKFDSWIFKIARNLSSDFFKSRKYSDGNKDFQDFAVIVDENDRDDDVMKLKLVLKKLSPQDREILVLSRFQEMKYAQIAEILGTTENAVKIKAYRALKKLKKLFFESVEI